MAKEETTPEDNIKETHKAAQEPVDEPEKEETSAEDAPLTHQETGHQPPAEAKEPKKKFDFKAFWATKKGKIVTISAAAVVVIALVFAIPASRYAVAGVVIKKDLSVQVNDSKTGKPISAVDLSVAGQTAKTDKDGKATFHNVPVGLQSISGKKAYYQNGSATALVPILSSAQTATFTLNATGRQVPISVTNKITGAPLANVAVTADSSAVTTADDGTATIVVPADKATVNATFKLGNYNSITADITVTEQQDAKNNFALTPAGKVYFLSKRTGKINVMKSDLDGANATVVVEGTGKENEGQTVLLASRDWKYLALQATRDSDTAKLYLINTADDKLSVIDEGTDVDFSPVGWSDDNFIYKVIRSNVHEWEAKRQSLKSFNAASGKIATLDDTDGTGNSGNWAYETYTSAYILDDAIVYSKYWSNSFLSTVLMGKKDAIYSVKATGDGKKSLKDFDATNSSYIQATLYKPDEIYFRIDVTPSKYYEYSDGNVVETAEVNDNNFYNQQYNTYLVSPSGKNTFWTESRDGKNVSFVGDISGANGKQVLADDDFVPYGWYSDDYLLFSKKGSELYVLPRTNTKNVAPLKITDYHKPSVSFPGYGYGYGGGF